MKGQELRQARLAKGWTQQDVAQRLGGSQGYVSLLENEGRPVPSPLAAKLRRLLALPPTALPVADDAPRPLTAAKLARQLAALGYPGYAYLRRNSRSVNPAELLLTALRENDLEPRLAAALPWVAFRYPDLDWPWLLERAKVHDLQNRLGFTLRLARRTAERLERQDVSTVLAEWEEALERARLAREDTFCRESMTDAEKRWLRERRPQDAAHWNLLTNLTAEHLSYAQ